MTHSEDSKAKLIGINIRGPVFCGNFQPSIPIRRVSGLVWTRSTSILETNAVSALDQSRPIFQSLTVTKPVVTQTTNGYQIKDLENTYISIETPWFTVLQIVWLLQLVKLEHFSKNQ